MLQRNSSETVRGLSRLVGWLLIAAVMVFTLAPIGIRPVTAAPADLERFVAFVLIGGAFYIGYPRHHIGFVLLVIGIAGLLEVLQNIVPGRHGHWHDYFVKATGVLIGTLLARLAEWAFIRR
ncbi:VanZ family protein [Microvirga flavescens]|uniref:VanZ family protein n=1 Tax=Microvirga flavescens TaxID=2249811 RepID=UPI001300984A|nr:VanZ family protein [Microvirga flavescens]